MKPMTIKEVARKAGVSECAVKKGVVDLLAILPMKKRVMVMEYLLYCKQLKSGAGGTSKHIDTYLPKQKKIEIKV